MDFRLAREIYSQAWYVDSVTIHSLNASLEFYRNNGYSKAEVKNNNFSVLPTSQSVISNKFQLRDLKSDEQAISLLRLDGPITKHGGMSHYGTKELSNQLLDFDGDNRILGHILFIESGGGSAVAVQEMAEAMQLAEKPIVVFIDGIMASAAMYIGSYADYRIANRATDRVGSIGTMIEFSGYPKIAENKETGARYVRIYADKSTMKNNEFESAINELDFKPIIEKTLNPFNERFITDMKTNIPNIRDKELTGEIFEASEVVGTLIDDIGNFQTAINKVLELSGASQNNNINVNQKFMNVQELQQTHPDLYNSIIKSERDRVNAYMAYADVDIEAVKKGIESGENPSQTFFAEMNRKALNASQLAAAAGDSPDAIAATKEKKVENKDEAAVKAVEAEVFANMGLKLEEAK